jgi:serine/threonine protein kinase
LSNSPTLVNSVAASQAGMIIGTAAYMSPEQARGKQADARSDLFSFGCVLYVMLTGQQAFQGEEVSDILASVLAREPDFMALPTNLSPQIRKLLGRCLAKNPKERWQSAGDLRFEIQDALASPAAEQVQTTAPPIVIHKVWRERILGIIATAAIVAFAVALWAPWHTSAPTTPLRITGELGTDVS